MKRTLIRSFVAASTLVVFSACNTVKQDKFKGQGGNSPVPSGLISGSVVYSGPLPRCEYRAGKPSAVVGRVLLTLFDFDNPPAPEGRASSAKNLFVLAGDRLFSLKDCPPADQEPAPATRITRSASFVWPSISLAQDHATSFQIRGFYDADGDMLPFFRVRNLPTAGDIAGGALIDASNPQFGFLRIDMPSQARTRRGYEVKNLTVTLGSPVLSQRPMFKLSEDRFLDAHSVVKAQIDARLQRGEPVKTLENVWRLTCADDTQPEGCGLRIQLLTPDDVGDALEKAGVEADFDPERYAFFVEPVDVKGVRLDLPDTTLPDGVQDPHPIFGSSLGLDWSTPIVISQRTALLRETDAEGRTEAYYEAQAGIPSVSLLGTVMPADVPDILPPEYTPEGAVSPRVVVDEMRVAIPPIGVVDLDPIDTSCRVLYVPPGNVTTSYELRVAECKDLPTGTYGVNVLGGIAGGTRREETDARVSDNGWVVDGARLSGQAWSVPNELGDEAQLSSAILDHQGRSKLFVVHQDNPDGEQSRCTRAPDPTNYLTVRDLAPRGICAPDEEPFGEDILPGTLHRGSDGNACLPQRCCDAVAHLCGVTLCEPTDQDGHTVRSSPTALVGTGANGRPVPNCIPFPMPDLCCPTE